MRTITRLALVACLLFGSMAQAQAIDKSWRDMLSYNSCKCLAISNSRVYCATDYSLFYIDKDDFSSHHLTPIEGMAETMVSQIAYCDKLRLLVVAYTSGNIDLLYDNGKIVNLSGLKDKNFTSDKHTNHIFIDGTTAYLSCNFGIISINLERREFVDAYILGTDGNYMKVNSSAIYGGYLYALTDNGLMRGPTDNLFLTDLKNWEMIGDSTIGTRFTTSCIFNNRLIVNAMLTADGNVSRVSAFDGKQWQTIWDSLVDVRSLTSNNGYIVRATEQGADAFDSNFNIAIYNHNYGIEMGVVDNNHNLWYAHRDWGLIRCADWGSAGYTPDGPARNQFFSAACAGGALRVAPGGMRSTGNNMYYAADIFSFSNGKWSSINRSDFPQADSCRDVIGFADGNGKNHFFAFAWGYGLIEYDNGKYTWFNNQSTNGALSDMLRISSATYDRNGNLWMACAFDEHPVAVRTASGQWYSYSYGSTLSGAHTGKIICTSNNELWIICPRGAGIMVIDHNGTPETNADDHVRHFYPADADGNNLNNRLNDIAVDANGALWIASDEGVFVYDNPEYVMQGYKFYARQPQMVIDGYYQTMLGTERVTSIVIDDGNRKWFGTDGGGIFLISADGTTQYAEYNTSNSPLFSNSIKSMAYDSSLGVLYIITDKGMQAVNISSSKSSSSMADIHAYPNPVTPSYYGDVIIRGVADNTVVRITDLMGNLMFETMSNGGGAIWNLRDTKGRRVETGIYLIQCVTEDGTAHKSGKIHVVK